LRIFRYKCRHDLKTEIKSLDRLAGGGKPAYRQASIGQGVLFSGNTCQSGKAKKF